jgi:hypothetical protein
MATGLVCQSRPDQGIVGVRSGHADHADLGADQLLHLLNGDRERAVTAVVLEHGERRQRLCDRNAGVHALCGAEKGAIEIGDDGEEPMQWRLELRLRAMLVSGAGQGL